MAQGNGNTFSRPLRNLESLFEAQSTRYLVFFGWRSSAGAVRAPFHTETHAGALKGVLKGDSKSRCAPLGRGGAGTNGSSNEWSRRSSDGDALSKRPPPVHFPFARSGPWTVRRSPKKRRRNKREREKKNSVKKPGTRHWPRGISIADRQWVCRTSDPTIGYKNRFGSVPGRLKKPLKNLMSRWRISNQI